jgi:ribosomal protein S18 acetylase RimI-like enzyme
MEADAVVLERMFRGVGRFYARFAEVSPGGRAIEDGAGVDASVVPALAGASIVNCVTYVGAAQLEASLGELARTYEGAGVRAWSVWTHERDTRVRELLAAASFVLDSEPMAMVLDLAGGDPPAPAPDGLEWTSEADPSEVAAVVDASYGFPSGTFAHGFPRLPSGVHAYLAHHDGAPAGVVLAHDLEGDCGIYLVGTVPEARGLGISTALMGQALHDAAARGCTVSTLQASSMGHPLYRRLGYLDLGRAELWERRRR